MKYEFNFMKYNKYTFSSVVKYSDIFNPTYEHQYN